MTMRRGLLVALTPAAFLVPAASLAAQETQVVFERTGYRLTAIGASVSVGARVLDGRRRPVPNAPITWRIQDPDIAGVSNRGEVVSRRVGRTRVWAVSGRDSASALILVDQWAASFAFNPPVLRFAAVGENRPIQVQARDASGNAIPGIRAALACRVINEQVATLASNGQVQARASGVTYVRCADRGVADSVRVEVRQRPVRASIENKGAFAQRTAGDTFQIRMSAVDAEGRPVADARPTWASLEPGVVNVDPLTGRARAVSAGAAKIVAQIGDLTDTVNVTVLAGAGPQLPPSPIATENAATTETTPRATLRIFATYPSVGDTARVEVNARDATGTAVAVDAIRFRSSDTSIVKSLGAGRLVGLKVGEAFLVATYASMTDSTLIAVSARGARGVTLAGASNFVRPSYDTAAALNRNRAQIDSARRAILQASAIKVATGRHVSLSFLGSQSSHASQVSEEVTESRTGLMYGGRLSGAWFRRLPLRVDFLTGTLVGDQAERVEDMTVTQVEGVVTFAPVAWLAIRGGYTRRAETTEVAALQWQFVSAGVQSRYSFVGGRIGTWVDVSVLPVSTLKTSEATSKSADPTSMAGEAGIEVHTSVFTMGLSYYTERFTFPVENAFQRIDQFSMLRLRLGLQAGR